jgi:aminoglycoside-2''-adenylyltransferase
MASGGTIALHSERWDAWRPEEAARRLVGVRAPWYVAAGWALDLFVGEQRREHEDLEIAVPAARFREVADALTGLELFVPGKDEAGHEIGWPLIAAESDLDEHHQTWVREPSTGAWRMDVFREPSDGDDWICRRDARIHLPYDRVIARTDDGIPYARPEIVLLFKAKHARDKDESDFEDVLPLLEPDGRRWLERSIALVHPGHAWLDRLG